MMKAGAYLEPFIWVALGGALVWGYYMATATRAAKEGTTSASSAKLRQSVAKSVAFGPRTTLWSTPHGDVIELTVPAATVGGRLLEVRRCIVWRDPNTRASSMSCAEPALDLVPSDGPEVPE